MNQEIAIYNRIQDPIAAVQSLGKSFAVMFGFQNEAQGQFLALASMAENKTPFEILRTYHNINGQLSKKALVIAAEFRKAGGKYKWIHTGKDRKKAEAEFTFEGQTLVETFTIEEAKQRGLLKPNSNWIKTPANMLRARVITNGVGMLAPEIIAGVSDSPEDLSDPANAATGASPLPEREVKPAKVDKVETVKSAPIATTPAPEAATTPAVETELVPETEAPKAKPVVSNWTNPRGSE